MRDFAMQIWKPEKGEQTLDLCQNYCWSFWEEDRELFGEDYFYSLLRLPKTLLKYYNAFTVLSVHILYTHTTEVHIYIDSKALDNTCIAVLASREILDSGDSLSWKPSFLL